MTGATGAAATTLAAGLAAGLADCLVGFADSDCLAAGLIDGAAACLVCLTGLVDAVWATATGLTDADFWDFAISFDDFNG